MWKLHQDSADGRHYVAVGEHHPFGESSRAGSVAYRAQVGRLRRLFNGRSTDINHVPIRLVLTTVLIYLLRKRFRRSGSLDFFETQQFHAAVSRFLVRRRPGAADDDYPSEALRGSVQ